MEPGTAFEPSPEQPRDDQADVARLLYMHSKPYGQRYEEWGQEHPILKTGAELGTNYVLNEAGVPVLRMLGLHGMAEILDRMNELGGLGGFGKGAEEIANPRLRLEKNEAMSSATSDMLDLYSNETNKRLGYVSLAADPSTRQLHVNMATNIFGGEKQYGTGQYLHLLRTEAENRYPDMEWLRFFRTSGAGPANKKRYEDVTLPLKSYDQMTPEGKRMYDRFVSLYGKPIRRVRLGGASTEIAEDDEAAARIAEEVSSQAYPRPSSIESVNREIAAGNERLRRQLSPEETAAQLTPEQMRMRRYGDEIARQVGRPWTEEEE